MRVPYSIGVDRSTLTECAGTKLGEFYTNPEVALKTFLIAKKKFRDLYGIEIKIFTPDVAYVGISGFGSKIIFPEDAEPMVKEPLIKDLKQIKDLKIPDPYKDGLGLKLLENYAYLKEKTGEEVGFGFHAEGPITTAVLLRGQKFFLDVYDNPDLCHLLLEKVTESTILYYQAERKIHERPLTGGSVGIGDDFASLLSPRMFEEIAFPYLEKIYKAMRAEKRHFHSDLKRDHLKLLLQLGISSYGPHINQYNMSPSILKEELNGKISWGWGIVETDLIQKRPEEIEALYVKAIEEGAPYLSYMSTAIFRGTPHANIKAFLKVASRHKP